MDDTTANDQRRRSDLRSESLGMLIGAVFCAVGGFFYYAHLADEGGVDAIFVWSLRLGVMGLAVCAALAWMGLRAAMALEVAVCGALTVILAVTTVAFLATGYIFDALLVGVAAVLAGSAARRSLGDLAVWRGATIGTGHAAPRISTDALGADQPPPYDAPSPPPPAAERPLENPPEGTGDAKTKSSEPPPEGFLAELGREDD